MKYIIYKPTNESIIKDIEKLEGVFVFPSISYKLEDDDTTKLSIENILISYNANNDTLFEVSFLNHLSRLDEYTFYAILETDKLNIINKKINSGTYMVNFIASLNYAPFFITNKYFLICGEDGEPFEDNRYGIIDRFVGNGQFNPFLVLLDKFEYKNTGRTEYQVKKFKNALIALRWIISYGFPYNKIIDWDKNKIIDDALKNKIRLNDVPFDTDFIEGNREYRFCRFIRYGLKEFMLDKKELFEKLKNINLIDPSSPLFILELLKYQITDNYILNTQSLSNILDHIIYQESQRSDIFSPAFIVDLRIPQPEGFTERFLEEKGKHLTVLGGMKWDIKPVKTLTEGMQRYKVLIFPEKSRVNIVDLSKILEEIKKLIIRLLIKLGLNDKDLINSAGFWLNYLEIVIPKINDTITTALVNMFNKEFGMELMYSRKKRQIYDPKENELLIRLYFGNLSVVNLEQHYEIKSGSNIMERIDPFTKAAINYALSGNYLRGKKLLEEIYKVLDLDRNSKVPIRFQNYILNNENNLIIYLTEKHPMSFMSAEDYNILKNDVHFLRENYHFFEDINMLIDGLMESKEERYYMRNIYQELKYLGIYKQRDLSQLDELCWNITNFFIAQYRKEVCR